MRTALAMLGAVVALPGCSFIGQTMFGHGVRECDGFDVPLSVFTGSTRKELRSRVIASGIDETYPFVVETNPQSLVIVGFTPLGTKSFTLTRTGDDVKIDKLAGGAVKMPPRNVMEDVLSMSLPSACATIPEGPAPAAAFDHWQVVDTCSNSRPQKRTIAKSDESAKIEIEVEYRPEAIVVRQKRCGYIAAYVLQASAPMVGVDVKSEEPPEAATEPAATPAPSVTPAPTGTPAPSVTPAPAPASPAPGAATTSPPAATPPAAPAATPPASSAPSAAPAAPPAASSAPNAAPAAPNAASPATKSAPAAPAPSAPASEKPAAAKPAAPAIIRPEPAKP